MIEHSDQIVDLIAALHKVQGEIEGVGRDSTNSHFKKKYATLEAVISAAKPSLQAHGIAFVQAPGRVLDGSIELTTMLLHTSGQWMRSTLHIPLAKTDPQGTGSAITYGCRYSLMAMLGLPPVDDDGEAAVGRNGNGRQIATADEYIAKAMTAIESIENVDALKAWWRENNQARQAAGLTQASINDLIAACRHRETALTQQVAA